MLFIKIVEYSFPPGNGEKFSVGEGNYLDDPDLTPIDKLQSDIFLLDQDIKVDDEIGKYTVDGGCYAVGRFEITMSGFTDAWHAMCRLIEEHGCQAVDGPVLCRNGVV